MSDRSSNPSSFGALELNYSESKLSHSRAASPQKVRLLLAALLTLLVATAFGDIPWPEVEARITSENLTLAEIPATRGKVHFVVCTIYFTPKEIGITPDRGFSPTTATLQRYPEAVFYQEFLDAVRLEGIGRLAAPLRGRWYLRYEGRGRFGVCDQPTGLHRAAITPRISCAVHSRRLRVYPTRRVQLLGQSVVDVFGNDVWRVGDTGGGLRPWQIDLYWGEDEPLGPGKLRGRPRGTLFEYGYAYVRSVGSAAPEFRLLPNRSASVDIPVPASSAGLISGSATLPAQFSIKPP